MMELRNKFDFNKLTSFIQAIRLMSTSSPLNKKTPHTIGKKSWVRAAERRKYLEQKMKLESKSEFMLQKEEILARQEPQVEFLTTGRLNDNLDESIMHKLLVKPEVFLSKDRHTIICYHPPPHIYPQEYTKSIGEHLFKSRSDLFDTFSYEITKEQISEADELRNSCPKTWNVKALACLFKVKPETIRKCIPLSKEQIEMIEAEKSVFDAMSLMKRRMHYDLQRLERIKYARKTRGEEFADWYSSVDNFKMPRQPIPPKISKSPATRGLY
ncbi:uncharacterized protein LOC100198714 isoform X1 [Hydra vulgaris]|uniref:uncharacterized protein LOC100198714 isoform X1 n=1 Tax=Hydra vulgaris TaxID=6087 RepID=UPI0002B4B53D|nr:uncharacterized protein LOC100198714 [Hydra vulgaris]